MSETRNKKKVSKGVRRARSMRNMIMMVLVCVLMLSAATYAWFTLSNTAKVANLTMKVGEETSLMIAPDISKSTSDGKAGTYGSVLEFGSDYKIKYALQPATMTDAGIQSPVYDETGTKVTSVAATTAENIMTDSSTSDAGKFYCYKTTFFLKTAGNADVKVKLKGSNLTNTYGEPASKDGTYIVNKTASDMGARAIRIKLSAGDTSIIYEPLKGYTLPEGTYEKATDESGVSVVTATNVQGTDGQFSTDTGRLTVKTTDTRVTMEVWLEGTDACCVNQIMADDILGQLAFEVVEDPVP